VKVTANDTGNIDQASTRILSGPSHGTTSALGGSGNIRYVADPGYVGKDSFSYEVCDSSGSCAAGTVVVNVTN